VHALAPLALGGKPKAADYLAVLAQLMPITELVPARPRIAERTTGEVMGEAAERMATRNEIGREEQDEFAARSHHRAAAAIASGRFDEEVCTVDDPRRRQGLRRRTRAGRHLRGEAGEAAARVQPGGTLTAGNSSPLTDGAAAVLLMSEEKARALGFTPLAALGQWAYSGSTPPISS
jgi:acetyl-CoA acyltransferase